MMQMDTLLDILNLTPNQNSKTLFFMPLDQSNLKIYCTSLFDEEAASFSRCEGEKLAGTRAVSK